MNIRRMEECQSSSELVTTLTYLKLTFSSEQVRQAEQGGGARHRHRHSPRPSRRRRLRVLGADHRPPPGQGHQDGLHGPQQRGVCSDHREAGPPLRQVHLQGPQLVRVEARQADAARPQPDVVLQHVHHRLQGSDPCFSLTKA